MSWASVRADFTKRLETNLKLSIFSTSTPSRTTWQTLNSVRQSCRVVGIWLVVLSLLCAPITCERLPPIFWNATNPEFHQFPAHPEHRNPSTRLHSHHRKHLTIDVRIRDLVDIVCPFHENPNDTDAKMFGYLEIHQVSKHAFETCTKSESSKIVGICGAPENPQIVSLSIRRFTPKPGGLEFTPGFAYYFTTTSNGTIEGMKNTKDGLCTSHNMKMQLNIFSSQYRHHKHRLHLTRPTQSPQINDFRAIKQPSINSAQSKVEDSQQAVININSPHEPHANISLRNSHAKREGSSKETLANNRIYPQKETLANGKYTNQHNWYPGRRLDNSDPYSKNHERSQMSALPRTGHSSRFSASISSDPRSYPLIYLLGRQAMPNTLHNHTHAAYIVGEEYWPRNSSCVNTPMPFIVATLLFAMMLLQAL